MQRRWIARLLIGVVTLGVGELACLAETLYLGVQSAPIRSTPSPFGKTLGTMSHGTAVTILQKQEGWYMVQTPAGLQGWANQSQFQKDKVVLTAGQSTAQTGASAKEQGAAAKGFTPQVEAQYKDKNPDLTVAYGKIDRMEKLRASETEVVQFLKEGGIL